MRAADRIRIREARMNALHRRAAETTKIGEATRLVAELDRMEQEILPAHARARILARYRNFLRS